MAESNRDEIDKLEALYAANPDGRVFTHLAEAHRKAGELERAREILEAGLARHEDYSSAHVVLGRILMDQGESTAAGEAFRRVIELDPQNLVALRTLGDLAEQNGDHEAALGYYDELLHRDRGDEELQEKVAALRAEAEREAAAEAAPPQPSSSGAAYAPYGESSDGPTHELLELPDLDAAAGSAGPAEDTSEEDRFALPPDEGASADADALTGASGDLDLAGFDTEDDETVGGELDLAGFDGGEGWGVDDDLALEPQAAGSTEQPEDAGDTHETGPEAEFTMPGGHEVEGGLEAPGGLGTPDGHETPGGFSPFGDEDRDAAEEAAEEADDLELGWSALEDEAAGELPGDLAFYQDAEHPDDPAPDADEAAEPGAEGEPDEPPPLLEEAAPRLSDAALAGDEARGMETRRQPAGEMMTETMADLYLRQNFPDRAAEIFRALLRERPGDARLEARLAAAEAVMAGPARTAGPEESAGTVDAPPGLEDVFFSAGDEGAEDRVEDGEASGEETDADGTVAQDGLEDAFFGQGEGSGQEAADTDQAASAAQAGGGAAGSDEPPAPGAGRSTGATAGEGAEPWLQGVESAWTGRAGAGHDEPSPYAPDSEDAEERPAPPRGPTAASYLDQVLAWRPREDPPAAGQEESPVADTGAAADADGMAATPGVGGFGAAAGADARSATPDVDARDAAPDADEEELLLEEIVGEQHVPSSDAAPSAPAAAGDPFPFEQPARDEGPAAAEHGSPRPAESTPQPVESAQAADTAPEDEPFPFEMPLDDAPAAGAGEVTAAQPAPPPPPAASPPPAAERRPGTATRDEGDVAEAFASWYDAGDDGAAEPAPGGEGDAGTSLTKDMDEDAGADEDLDMFRSWLQSLKK